MSIEVAKCRSHSDFNCSQIWLTNGYKQICQTRGLVNDYGTISAINNHSHTFNHETVTRIQIKNR